MIWVVHCYRGTQYLCMAVPWAFKGKDAADYWIAHRADKLSGLRYVAEQLPVYTLADVQSFTA